MKSLRSSISLKLCLLCILIGIGIFAGASFAIGYTDQRPFCASCHTMLPAAVTQKMSTHTNLNCNECHLPANFTERLPYKAYVGLYDMYAENFKDVQLPLVATSSMKTIVNDNCKRCHSATNMNVASMESKPYCVDCHRNVPHQRTTPVSTRMVAYE